MTETMAWQQAPSTPVVHSRVQAEVVGLVPQSDNTTGSVALGWS